MKAQQPVLVSAIVLMSLLGAPLMAGEEPATLDERYTIRLGAAELQPADGLRDALSSTGPFLIQFYDIPDEQQLELLRSRGVTLTRYASGYAYIAYGEGGEGAEIGAERFVRATMGISPEMKRSRLFDTDPELAEKRASGEVLKVHLRFFAGTSFDRARSTLAEIGVPVDQDRFDYGNALVIEATWNELSRLLESSELMWMDPALPETGPSNQNAAKRSRVTAVRHRPEFLAANGSTTRVGIWDWFPVGTHTDLEDRVTSVRVRSGEHFHGLFISGIIAGAGLLDRQAKGMAPRAELYWYSWINEPWTEMQEARDTYGISVVNNSWNTHPGWRLTDGDSGETIARWNGDLWSYGYYHSRAAAADQLVRESDLLVVFSAGNHRYESYLGPHFHGDQYDDFNDTLYEDLHGPNPEYTSMPGTNNGKNVVAVGGTTRDDAMTGFSSWGPTLDGRVKPDIVATAVVYSTTTDDGYLEGGGTSASAGVVSGTAALLSDYHRRLSGSDLSSVMLKNLLVHSARDMANPGPDYVYGHGFLDAELAARILRAAAAGGSASAESLVSFMSERQLKHGDLRRTFFTVPEAARELRATLVWHDVPGELLVNDLDVWLKPRGGETVNAFVLDADHPDRPATRKRNRVDNVESVFVRNPVPGKWKVFVRGTSVPMGPQRYSLIISASDGNRPPVKKNKGSCELVEFFTTGDEDRYTASPKDEFHDGDPLYLYLALNVSENADYGHFFGTLDFNLAVTDESDELIYRLIAAVNDMGSREEDWPLITPRVEIPSGLASGTYRAVVTITMHNGFEQRAEYPFAVD